MTTSRRREPPCWRGLIAPGACLLAWCAATVVLSKRFGWPHPPEREPIEWFVLLQVAGGGAFLWTVSELRRAARGRVVGLLAVVVGVGLVLRLALFLSTPILENDYQRYLWDGAVTAHGLDAYAHTPDVLLRDGHTLDPAWSPLLTQGRPVLEQVNHPKLATIYPPVAQGAFALAHHIAPWEPRGLRVVWLGFDLAVCALLILGIGRIAARPWQLAVYWLNPLLLRETYNALHMEIVLLAFVTAALVAARRSRVVASCAALGLAIGAKLWPAMWVPLVLRMRGLTRRHIVWGLGIVTVITTVLVVPLLLKTAHADSGLREYARRWEMNDSIFVVIQAFFWLVASTHAALLARLAVGAILLVMLVRQVREPVADGADLTRRALLLVAALFLLSPTQFPWYFLWCLPVLALHPNQALLLLTMTLPLYYLRFRFVEHGTQAWFDYGLVWLQFLPTWTWLAHDGWRTRRMRLAEAS